MVGSRGSFATAVLVAVLFGAGCGGTDLARRTAPPAPVPQSIAPRVTTATVHDPALRARLLQSATQTAGERTAHTSISVTLTGLGNKALAAGAFDVAGSGVVDLQSGDARLKLSVPHFDRLGGGGTIEQRIVERIVYTKLPARILKANDLPHTVRWLSLDPLRPRHAHASDASALSQSQADPAGQLAFLDATSDDVRRVGSEAVRGAAATHYAATIEVARSAGGVRVASVRKQLAALGAVIGTRRITVDAWLDRDGCARRIVVGVPLAPKKGSRALDGLGPNATMRIQGDFYGFGTRVRVAAPPQAQVRPYRALQRS
jgi:hypothetical protein